MARVSKDSVSQVHDRGMAEDRTEHVDGGYTVNFVSIRQDADLTPMLRGLPGDACQCPHWGYMFQGRMTVRYADREEVVNAGDAFYLPPGHVPSSVAGTEFVQFSPTEELMVVQAAMAANMQRMTGG